jgi:hypothetical protein
VNWEEPDPRPSSRPNAPVRINGTRLLHAPPTRPAAPTRKGRWTQAEVAKLKDLYGLRDERSIARELQRSPASVRRMVEVVFPPAIKEGPWSALEIKQLKNYLGASSSEVIAHILGRDPREVEAKILELGRLRQPNGRWSREDTLNFKRIYGRRSDEHLGVIFGRTREEIVRHADRLRLAKDKAFVRRQNGSGSTRMPRWSQDELDYLRRNYPVASNIEIAQHLGRSVKSVISKAHYIGLKKTEERLREMGRENVSLRYNGSI